MINLTKDFKEWKEKISLVHNVLMMTTDINFLTNGYESE